jgi:prepilin-type N-terminal cleavage/methylation domain-containing protein
MKRGLTLLELAIAMAVLAVLSALAVPTMASRLRSERLQIAADMLAADIADARHEAARRGSALHVEARSDGAAWCWSVATSVACPCSGTGGGAPAVAASPPSPQAATCRLKAVPAQEHPGVSLVQSQAVRLDPDGQASPVLAAVKTAAGERQLQVQVTRFGRARVCDPLGNSPKAPRC